MKIILKRPIITEKSNKLSKEGVFTFLVDKSARKDEIKRAVEEKFDVKVMAVRTANYIAKTKSQRSRKGYFTVAGYKKAMVVLKKGQKIGLFAQEADGAKVTTAETETVKEKKSLLKGTKVKIEKKGSK
ncbi:MAG: 50S ribosomal protein L23 [Candidatus Daviesbacteria bacterium]|nr:50S ribosomal protein L23 [Candidatus Daviesbacteria bacterium]